MEHGTPAARRMRLLATRIYLIVTPSALGDAWEPTLATLLGTRQVGMVQLREKTLPDGPFLERARALRALTAAHDALLVLNDRVHLVAPAEADGAHVGEDDLAPEAAREMLGPDRLLGLSTHDEAEVEAAAGRGADHVGLGPCFTTTSKTLARRPGGADLVLRCLPVARGIPVFPIGGITPENAGCLVAAGARRVAVGAGVLEAPDPEGALRRLARALDAASARGPTA